MHIASLLWATAASPGAAPLALALQSLDGRPIVRIPAVPAAQGRQRGSGYYVFREQPSPRCHPAARVASAQFSQPGTVDLVMHNRRIYRALLAPDCPPLGYYSALYLAPGADGRVCAGRDTIVSRAGGECLITGFRRLELLRRR